jgi:DnaJ-class molecular chaperone
MKKLFLLFFATAAMTLVSCGGSSSEGSSSSSSSMDDSTQMNAPVTTPQSSTATPDSAVSADAQEPASEPATCSKCGGSGKVKCSKCHGRGYFYDTMDNFAKYEGCSKCGGKGHKMGERFGGTLENYGYHKGSGKMKCPECGGSGKK